MEKDKKLLYDSVNLIETILKEYKRKKIKLENIKSKTPRIFKTINKNLDKKISSLNETIEFYNGIYQKECKYFYDFN